ncbi:MAG: glycosyltransferase [Opitutaceae bacterium]|nr:glycosyltransferase [Opitutaceae bacterium]
MNSASILLSVVTITRNNPDGLARTVESAAALRGWGVEHIVVDGSDGQYTPQNTVCCSRAGVRYIYREPEGISDAFNFGLSEAHGEWIWFVNGGDAIHELLEPSWLLGLLSKSGAAITTGGIHYDGEPQIRYAPMLSDRWPLLSCWFPHPATLVRRNLLVAVGGFDLRYAIAMDYDLWLRLAHQGVLVDVISMPFARFDLGGVSNQVHARTQLLREESRIILEQWKHLLRQNAQMTFRVAGRLLRALRHQFTQSTNL